MSQNEVVSLQAAFKTWKSERMPANLADNKVTPFEYYCTDQFLKQFSLSDEELLSGLVAGGQDGGLDAVYCFANRRLIQDDTQLDPKAEHSVSIQFLQIKENQGFSPTEIGKFEELSDDFLNLAKQQKDYHSTYNAKLLNVISTFKQKYSEIAGSMPKVSIDYYYITQNDFPPAADAIKAGDRVVAKAKEHFSSAECEFHYVHASQLWKQIQLRPTKIKTLEWHDSPLSTNEGLVGLMHLHDYYQFLQDENGDLHENIFESNVRGFQQNTQVNVAIHDTLTKPGKADFWILHNGITILSQKSTSAGHKRWDIKDPQIVNGLQTSRQIYQYFKDGIGVPARDKDSRRILVRVLEESDAAVRDAVIRATNSQNKMPPEALRTTDEIHRQIESLFRTNDLYYDRRKGHYKDEKKPIAKIVSVTELLQATVAIVLKRPDDARGRPGDYLKDEKKYKQVFEEGRFNLSVYLKCLSLYRRIGAYLAGINLDILHQRNVKFYLAMYVAAMQTKNPNIPPSKLLKIDLNKLDDKFLDDCHKRVMKKYEKCASNYYTPLGGWDFDQMSKGQDLLNALNKELKQRLSSGKKKQKRATS